MKERDLIALLAAIIWSQQREGIMNDIDANDDESDLASIREAVSFANDILVETEEFLKPPARSRVIDAEFVDDDRPARRR